MPYTVCLEKNETKMFFNIFYKTREILIKFGTVLTARESCKRFPPHLTNVSILSAKCAAQLAVNSGTE